MLGKKVIIMFFVTLLAALEQLLTAPEQNFGFRYVFCFVTFVLITSFTPKCHMKLLFFKIFPYFLQFCHLSLVTSSLHVRIEHWEQSEKNCHYFPRYKFLFFKNIWCDFFAILFYLNLVFQWVSHYRFFERRN